MTFDSHTPPADSADNAPVALRARRVQRSQTLSACNVVDCTKDHQQFWRFASSGRSMKLVEVRDTDLDVPVPRQFVSRDLSQMWKPHCQNDAWLPMEEVYFHVLQMPECEPAELLEMVEVQIERISPHPVAQVVWTYEVAPSFGVDTGQQTVVAIMAERNVVEDHLERMEAIGYRPDRLEVPILRQVFEAGDLAGGGVSGWIYPRVRKGKLVCLVAWWTEGKLSDISIVHMSAIGKLNELTEQLTSSAWAAEIAGSLQGPVQWHLVADHDLAEQWLPTLNEWAGRGVQVHRPPETAALAAACAQQAGRPLTESNLLPPEYRDRCHRDDVDRFWLGLAGVMTVLYALFVGAYFYLSGNLAKDEELVKSERDALKKTMAGMEEEEEKFHQKRLYDNLRLKALECMQAIAETLPETMDLEDFRFNDKKESTKNLTLSGTVALAEEAKVDEFREMLSKVKVMDPDKKEVSLFANVGFERIVDVRGVDEARKRWFITCELAMDREKRETKKKRE